MELTTADTKLLSSAAVFRGLYDDKKDIYVTLKEFITYIIKTKALRSFSAIECVSYFEQEFNFGIPEAIIKSCLRNRFVKTGELTLERGVYIVTPKIGIDNDKKKQFDESKEKYLKLIENLYQFCSGSGSYSVDRDELIRDFEDYLLRPEKASKNKKMIAGYIVNHADKDMLDVIHQIEEGLVLYTGIRYSPDISTLGVWRNDTAIYLDTEIMLSAVGLNGELYKRLFNDFHSLIREANRKRKGGKITLKYFEETEQEIISFFYAAQKIVEGHVRPDPSKTAMLKIIHGCRYASDVKQKKAIFMSEIKGLGIVKDDARDYYESHEYNIENQELISKLGNDYGDSKKDGSDIENEISEILKIFTKINVLRKGNNIGIDKVSAIFLTGSSLSLSLAFADGVFEGNGNIPFATDLDFLTERLWFKLNKGFGGDVVKPASFDPYIKAKIVLSSILSKSVSKVYSDMSEQYKDGKLNSENLAYLYAEIRNVPTNPDDVSNDTSYLSSDFLSDKYINDVIRSRQELEAKAIQGEEFKKKYFRETYEKKQLLLKPHKKNAFMTHFSIILLMVILLLVVIFLPLLFQSESDSLFTKLAYAWSAILTIISLVNAKKMNMYARKVAVSRYKKRKIK